MASRYNGWAMFFFSVLVFLIIVYNGRKQVEGFVSSVSDAITTANNGGLDPQYLKIKQNLMKQLKKDEE
jgi:hypothetical protein